MTKQLRPHMVLLDAVRELGVGCHIDEAYTADGYEIVLETDKGVVSVEVDHDGENVFCVASIGDNLRRAKYYQLDGLPDGFIKEAIRDLIKKD